ncbi:hypothetical protein PR202_ga23812 [Eleusine coracana subsp. coracana]|uniref:Pentatricopeptide repeat-containing protein n=1 Tax=Eleusine coracana subsp. coracana TaxID=191504 RepID=A0AAV5D554_ELECO|nr:hypothetical protein PR202_ga23812 [Eleusine coracana subsp. coracana]
MLCGYSRFGQLATAEALFCAAPHRDAVTWTVMLDAYCKHGLLAAARRVFLEMPERDSVTYNAMMMGCSREGLHSEALELFVAMHRAGLVASQFTFSSMLTVATGMADFRLGRQIHGLIARATASYSVFVNNSLLDFYSKCDSLDDLKQLFDEMLERSDKSAISWTALITGYVQNGQHEDALQLFHDMRRAGLSPDRATCSSIMKASSCLAMIGLGRQLHSYLIKSGHMSSVFSGSALLDMYGKCGCLDEALQTFDEMPEKNSITWNAVISAYAHYGQAKNAIRMFESMLKCGMYPDPVTFLCVLTACSHNGLTKECMKYFDQMKHHYCISPWKEHYSCVIDTLGRAGYFDEVQKVLDEMPFEAGPIIWSSILHSCRIHGNKDLASAAADKLFSMAPTDATPYVILSNIYAKAGQWEDAARVKKIMRDRGVRKESGNSWVEIKQKIYSFSSNDQTNPMIAKIKEELERLYKRWRN